MGRGLTEPFISLLLRLERDELIIPFLKFPLYIDHHPLNLRCLLLLGWQCFQILHPHYHGIESGRCLFEAAGGFLDEGADGGCQLREVGREELELEDSRVVLDRLRDIEGERD